MYKKYTLIIEKRYFSIKIPNSEKFRKFLEFLSSSDSKGMEEVLIDSLENKLDLEYLDIEPKVLSDKYFLSAKYKYLSDYKYLDENKYPKTDKIEITELEIEEENGVVVFNVKYIFEDFECDLDYYKKHSWRFDKEGLSIYGLQVKDEILKEYEARNLRYYVPETKVFLVNDEDFIRIKGA